MNLATGVLGSLISKLGELLKEEYGLQTGLRKKITALSRELESMYAALRKVAEVPPEMLDDEVRLWARDVRELSYDAVDVLDRFLVGVEGPEAGHDPSKKKWLKRATKMIRKFKARHKIDGIEQANVVAERHRRYKAENIVSKPASTSSVDPRLETMYKEVTQLVGIEQPHSELISMLSCSSNEEMKIVSVVGAGGLGKTTLAKAVYDELISTYDCGAFISVGRNPDLIKLLREVLIKLDKNRYMNCVNLALLDEGLLIDELREYLGSKRYLLVIDDIWETRSWETIKWALVQKNSGSRIITTTRILEVAKEAGEVYALQQLSYCKSKQLFYKRIFGDEGKCPDNQLDEVSDKILKKCDGVPLAIITMASLLVGKSREEWIEVCSSIAFRDRDNKQVSDTEWILSLSYYDLPPHLKTCLLYLSVFPEDEIIDKDSLIWKWLAEGFVHNDIPGTRLFEVGNGYFYELINRSMIQAVVIEDHSMVVGCHVHDMVLDLLRLKSQEENFVTISSSNNVEATSSQGRVRRLAHQNQKLVVEHGQMELGHVRSFIAYRCRIDDGFSLQSFKLLRVLALEHCIVGGPDKDYIGLKHLEKLLHLRYLRLGYSDIHEIPEEIGALKFLQTLELGGPSIKNGQLPSSVGLLTQMICLRARSMMVPNGVIEKLTSLEQLEIYVGEDTVGHFVKELDKLPELRVLYAEFDELDDSVGTDLAESLGNLHKIRHLELYQDPFSYLRKQDPWTSTFLDKAMWPRHLRRLIVPDFWSSEIPSCISPSGLPNLTHLNLKVYYMQDQHLKILGQLLELCHLKLDILNSDSAAKVTVTSIACTSTIGDGCFQKLRSLSLPSSSVMFLLNNDSSVVLFVLDEHLRIQFTAGNKCIGAAAAVMPNLQVIEFGVHVESGILRENLGLDCLPSLQRVIVTVNNWSCAGDELERDKAALRQAIEGHPNRPTLKMRFLDVNDPMGLWEDVNTDELI